MARRIFPVGGVSWYEAAAYAQFAGKSLPSIYHWYLGSGLGVNSQILRLSNFGGKGPAKAGTYLGLGLFGTYDMAGNMKEWVLNPSPQGRFISGGGWDEPVYMFFQADDSPAFKRDAMFGFRCARYDTPLSEILTGPVSVVRRDRSHEKPVDEQTFRLFEGLLSYDKTDLKAKVDSVQDALHWRKENVSFDAAYGHERVIAHLYLPKNAAPPYQLVTYFPASDALIARTPEEAMGLLSEYIVKSGRALLLPAYAGTLERGPSPPLPTPRQRRDRDIQDFKDLGRSLDYLETRGDIDASKLGYYGVSLGATAGPVMVAPEPRFKVAVFVAGCAPSPRLPEDDPWNYLPRVKIPVLMLNGRDDFLCPLEVSQNPFFRHSARRKKISATSSTRAAMSIMQTASR